MKNIRSFSFVLSITIILMSLILYTSQKHYWFYPATIGVWLFFDNLSHLVNNKTSIDLLIKKEYKKFLTLYLLLSIFGSLIELFGNFLLGLWSYTYLSPIMVAISTLLFYPFILLSFKETFDAVKSRVKNFPISLVLSMLIGIIVWEIPNLYSNDWIYKMPFANITILQLNPIVIIGWSVLVLGPVFINKFNDKIHD
ncbi:MAG: hypothetical protein HYW23_02855 [Candidatus Aenigmarchaeota archaeon]|nr:hypothetical protein [Candidatus Aenigmarchaeota archaeon]